MNKKILFFEDNIDTLSKVISTELNFSNVNFYYSQNLDQFIDLLNQEIFDYVITIKFELNEEELIEFYTFFEKKKIPLLFISKLDSLITEYIIKNNLIYFDEIKGELDIDSLKEKIIFKIPELKTIEEKIEKELEKKELTINNKIQNNEEEILKIDAFKEDEEKKKDLIFDPIKSNNFVENYQKNENQFIDEPLLKEKNVVNLLDEYNKNNNSKNEIKVLNEYLKIKEDENNHLRELVEKMDQKINQLEEQLKIEFIEKKKFQIAEEDARQQFKIIENEKDQLKKIFDSEIENLRDEFKDKVEKLKILEKSHELNESKMSDLKEKVNQEIKKYKLMQKEIENKLEMQKRDSILLLRSKDDKLIEQQKQLESLQFDYDHLKQKLIETNIFQKDQDENILRTIQSLKMNTLLLEENLKKSQELFQINLKTKGNFSKTG